MALRINTNVAALNAHQKMIQNDNKLSDSLGRLSTGLRINKAADDASGMMIADSLRAQHMGIGQAIRNANDGISMVQTADGALEESINIINTIKTKAIQAASDSQTTDTRKAIQADIDKLMEELDVIAKTTSFNGQKLLSGAFTNKKIQIGAFANETANVSIGSTESTKTGHISTARLSLGTDAGGEVELSLTSSITGDVLNLNKIDLQMNNSAQNGMGAMADEINRYSSTTGIKATAVVSVTSAKAIEAGTTGEFTINGVVISPTPVINNDDDQALRKAINDRTTEHGVEATRNEDGTITLTSVDGRAIELTGDVATTFGGNAGQMSTFGYINLTQSGSSTFQIEGIGAGATGANIAISTSSNMTTSEGSILAAESTAIGGSIFASGTIVGANMIVESSIDSTQADTQIKSGSTLYHSSELALGTVLGGNVVVSGNADTSFTGAGFATAITQDMLVAGDSTLKAGTILGKGTVITTEFSQNSHDYTIGEVLADALILTSDLNLDRDMTLKYDADTADDNSQIRAGSLLAAGSVMGAKFDIGATYSTAAGNVVSVSGAATGTAIRLNTDLVGGTASTYTIKAGSLLKDDTTLTIAAGAYTGPTLITDSGTLERGTVLAAATQYTLDGDQVMSADLTTAADTATTDTIKAGSLLTTAFAVGGGAGNVTFASAHTSTLSAASITTDMTLENGSELSAGSQLLSGSQLGDNTHVMGGTLDATVDDLVTNGRTELASGSTLLAGSTLGEGSTIGGTVTTLLSGEITLDSEMTLTQGTSLNNRTLLKAGTVVTQDMTLNTQAAAGGDTVEVTAGTKLNVDLYVETDGTILADDLTLAAGSEIGRGSTLAINTANSGSVGLSEEKTMRLSDLSVLTQEDAQFAIDIADAALKDLDKTRSGLGSVQNQLTSTIANLSTTKTNIQASESAIRDVDFAEEASTYSKMNLLSQTSSYALAQANASSQNVMSLLQ